MLRVTEAPACLEASNVPVARSLFNERLAREELEQRGGEAAPEIPLRAQSTKKHVESRSIRGTGPRRIDAIAIGVFAEVWERPSEAR